MPELARFLGIVITMFYRDQKGGVSAPEIR